MKHATSHAAELDLLALGGGGLLYHGKVPAYLRDAARLENETP
jgi:hypothetical protein